MKYLKLWSVPMLIFPASDPNPPKPAPKHNEHLQLVSLVQPNDHRPAAGEVARMLHEDLPKLPATVCQELQGIRRILGIRGC